jgi:hypothetical protein
MPTYTTLPLLILILVLWRLTRGNILAIIVFTAIFSAASALNFGNFGVSPWLMAMALCLPWKLLQGGVRWCVERGINRLAVSLVFCFMAYAALSGFVLPVVFQGVQVLRIDSLVPLSFGMANVAQICYLAAAAVVFVLTITSTTEELEVVMHWYVIACIVAAAIAMYQLANAVFHVPYPTLFFDSSPGHVIYPAYKIGGLWRLNSTFTEASDMVSYLIPGLGCLTWELMVRPLRLWRVVSAGLILVAIFMSLSTTGYVCLGLLFVVAGVAFVWRTIVARSVRGSTVVVALVVLLAGSFLFTLSSAARNSVMSVSSMVVLDKKQSESYRMRTESHVVALRTLEETDYMGAGWGSMRASGTVYTLLASVGVFGLILFTAASISVFLPLFSGGRGSRSNGDLLGRSLFPAFLLLAALVISGTEPDTPMVWLLFGIAIVAAAPLEDRRGALPWRAAQGQQVLRNGAA